MTRTSRWLVACLIALGLAFPATLEAHGSSKGGSAKSSGKTSTKSKATKSTSTNGSVARDAKGRIQRSAAARHAFARQTGYPNGRPGYVIDHVIPLACGGVDAPSNMQWQTIAEAKAKDKTERVGCGK